MQIIYFFCLVMLYGISTIVVTQCLILHMYIDDL